MSDHIKIEIPKGLPIAIGHKPKHKVAVTALLMLKSMYEAGKLKDETKAFTAASIALDMSYKTFKSRITDLIELELLTKQDGYLLFASWETLQEKYGYDHSNKFYKIHFAPYTVMTDSGRVKYKFTDEIDALCMQEIELNQVKAINAKVKFTPELKQAILNVTDTLHRQSVVNTQVICWKREGAGFNEDGIEALEMVRFDTAVSTDTYNYYFEYHGRGSMAYKKRRLEALGIIKVFHRQIDIQPGTHTTSASRTTDLGTVVATKEKLFLVMPDQVVFFKPNERKCAKAV